MGASAFYGPFTGVATGTNIHDTNTDDMEAGASHDAVHNRSTYQGRFTYSFRVDGFGSVSGTGHGVFTSPPDWDVSGVSGGAPFDCQNIPVTTTSGFSVEITGTAANGVARLRFRLENAVETNEELNCGGVYLLTAGTTSYLADSLRDVQDTLPNDEIVVSFRNPRIGHLGSVQTEPMTDGSRVLTNEWDITIAPPPPPEDIGGGPGGPGTASGPKDSAAAICTIKGTRRNNRLVGTPGTDIICGFGGNDVLIGRGGNDILVGGFGNDTVKGGLGLDSLYGNAGVDRLIGKDGKRDFLHGGPGRDSATRDRGKDKLRSIERVG